MAALRQIPDSLVTPTDKDCRLGKELAEPPGRLQLGSGATGGWKLHSSKILPDAHKAVSVYASGVARRWSCICGLPVQNLASMTQNNPVTGLERLQTYRPETNRIIQNRWRTADGLYQIFAELRFPANAC